MKLKRLEIHGFKSFAEKTELVFQQGTTAIVGPNGSGKSNISDAVRWVLGEQSAKSLRGAKMEDVIFGGTEKRKALAWCEVSLLFDNDDRALSMDCAEVLVTRRVWRSGESEYYLNKAACRLKDITNLFRDTGIGKDGYSLIGQGRIDDILSPKSDERREVFEEAAGIVTYRLRKEEAERHMDNTRQNLSRVDDIIGELEAQLAPLQKQAEDARAYLALQDRLRDLDLNAFIRYHDRHKAQITQQETLIATIDAEMEGAEPELAFLTRKREALNEKLDALDAEDTQKTAEVLEAARAVEAQEGANNVLRERIAHAQSDAHREEGMAQEETEQAASLQAMKAQSESEAERCALALLKVQTSLDTQEAALAMAQQEAASQEAALEGHKAAIMQAMNRMSDMKTVTARLTALQQSLTGRLQEAEDAAKRLGTDRQTLASSLDTASGRLATAQANLHALEAEARSLDEGVQASTRQSEALLENLRDKTAQRHQADSRLKVLREMERDYEGYQHAVRQALMYARRDKRIHGVVANILKTPKQYERALEMVLGGALQNIITEDEHAAKHMIEYLRENRFGRATFLPMTAVHGRTLTREEREVLTMPGCMGVASELVQFDAQYKGIVESLLGRTVVARDLDAGIEIMQRGRHAFRLVTLGGDVMHSGGSMTGGSVQSRMTSLLSREREIAEHVTLLAEIDQTLSTIQHDIKALDEKRAEQKRLRNELFDKAHQAEIDVAREQAHTANAEAELVAHDQRQAQAQLQAEQIRSNLSDIVEQLARAEADHEGGALDQSGMQQELAALQTNLTAKRVLVETLREAVTTIRMDVAAKEHALNTLRKDTERYGREEVQLSARQEVRTKARVTQAEALSKDILALESGERTHALYAQTLEAAREAQTACAANRQKLSHENRTLTTKLETLRDEHTKNAEKRHHTELQLVRAQGELKNLQERIWNEYELTYAGAMSYHREDFDLRESQKQITAIRGEIRAMGTVNVNAVENYALTKERYDHLRIQKDDLLKATADLENIIAELLIKMEKRFRKQFAQLNEYFRATFAMLFGGGNAELKLGDESDILNCAIDVVAQPPGKKLQLLSLLSGGERALTAIAILFAMLQLKPTPFCVLDEIEAALDEANVANFADYLKRFSETTQFVVVTHRRGTMERCEALYGVAMEEKGVSRMVSVKLADVGA